MATEKAMNELEHLILGPNVAAEEYVSNFVDIMSRLDIA